MTTLLVRQVGRWYKAGEFETPEEAEASWKRNISGRGVTAWSWWGPSETAAKMLADPSFDPDTEPAI